MESKNCDTACVECSFLSQCIESKDHIKPVARHIIEMKKLCRQQKQMLECLLEKALSETKARLMFTYLNLKEMIKSPKWRNWKIYQVP